MAIVPIPINLGSMQNVDAFEHGNTGTAALLKNMLINDAGSNVARPGLQSFVDLGSSPVIGLYPFGNFLVAVTDDRKIYSITESGGKAEIQYATLGGSNRPVFAEDGTYLAIAGGTTPQRWAGTIATTATEAMPGSPPSCTHISYLDGYWILHLVSDQELRWAGPTSSARETWSSANFFQAEGFPDDIIASRVFNRTLFAFGKTSTETFYNYGDTGNPFKRTFVMDVGCSAPYSLVQADNTLWWLDHDRRFVKMSGQTPQIISTPYDRVLKRFGSVSDCFGNVINIDGFYLIVWHFPIEERTLVYDYKQNYWTEWDGYANGESSEIDLNSYCYSQLWNKHFVGSATDGTIYELSFDALLDGSAVKRLIRRTGYISHGNRNRKRSNYYLFDVKYGLGESGGTEPVMQIRVNDDNQGWSDPHLIGLGFEGDKQEPIVVNMRGIYRKRQIEVQVTDAVDFVLNGIEEDVEMMRS